MTSFHRLENNDIAITISSLGATLVSFIDKKTGRDIVTGFDSVEGYLANSGCYMGAMVGRCANRIGGGQFVLDGIVYHVPINNITNCLHGGKKGLSFVEYDVKELKDEIILSYLSADNEEGFPGKLEFVVSYQLKGREVHLVFKGLSDKDTLFNITNHSYFNLSATDDTVANHHLEIPTVLMSYTDNTGLTYEKMDDISNTYYDFSKRRRIGESIKEVAIDNNYHFGSFKEKLMARLDCDGLCLEVYSDLPDMHVYPANHFDNIKGKSGKTYNSNAAIALEAQYYPNAINYRSYPQPILREGVEQKHEIIWKLRDC